MVRTSTPEPNHRHTAVCLLSQRNASLTTLFHNQTTAHAHSLDVDRHLRMACERGEDRLKGT
eukprot:CAMPEP_0182805734 /NCGR_PEP_ID=MMETSP0006_2-20121128/5225_1 /TAXON_ID=97485 /ORGANISM="Prymnesium parvum, Strain Texoma1" /LENGTH=61 /DNA_ID=CAMNT_0024931305 /DNA_START=80 /DNA_END=261 /DNA_ORIENTATION=+